MRTILHTNALSTYAVSFQGKWASCFAFCQDRHSVSSCNLVGITFKDMNVFGKLLASVLHNFSVHHIAHCLERQMLSRGQHFWEISYVRHTLLHWSSELFKSTGMESSEESEPQDALFAERGSQKIDCPDCFVFRRFGLLLLPVMHAMVLKHGC